MSVKIDYIPRYTVRDYEQWEGRWELIQGVPYAMSPQPSIRHQVVSQHISVELARALAHCESCQALLPVDWKIADGTVLQPDNLVVCEDVEGQYLTVPPILIFEILSPSTAYKDRTIKYHLYAEQGVRHYIIVDPEASVAEVFYLQDQRYTKRLDAQDDQVSFDLHACTMTFDFGVIW